MTTFFIFVVFILIFQLLYPLVFFLSEFLKWGSVTIIHWFFLTSLFIFVVFIPIFQLLYPWSSFYLDWWDEILLLLFIDFLNFFYFIIFPYLCWLYPDISAAISSIFLSIRISEMRYCYYYTLIPLDHLNYWNEVLWQLWILFYIILAVPSHALLWLSLFKWWEGRKCMFLIRLIFQYLWIQNILGSSSFCVDKEIVWIADSGTGNI